MKKVMILVLLCVLTVSALLFLYSNQLYQKKSMIYILELRFEGGEIYFKDIYVKDGYPKEVREEIEEGYYCKIFSFDNKELYSFKFLLPDKMHYDYIDEETGEIRGGVLDIEKDDFALTIPYFDNGNRINIYDRHGVLLFSVDISKFAGKKNSNLIIFIIFFALLFFIIILIILRRMRKDKYIKNAEL